MSQQGIARLPGALAPGLDAATRQAVEDLRAALRDEHEADQALAGARRINVPDATIRATRRATKACQRVHDAREGLDALLLGDT